MIENYKRFKNQIVYKIKAKNKKTVIYLLVIRQYTLKDK